MNYKSLAYVTVYWSHGNIVEYRVPIKDNSHHELIEVHYIKYLEFLPTEKCMGQSMVLKNFFPYRQDEKAKIFDKLLHLLGLLK